MENRDSAPAAAGTSQGRRQGQALTRPRSGRPSRSAPRQEYIDAFDDAHFGAVPAQRRRPSRSAGPAGTPGGEAGSGPGDRRSGRREGWVRTLTGVASAAVVTVLIVVAAGRMADPGADDRADGEQPAAPAETMPPGPGPSPAGQEQGHTPVPQGEPGYEDLMRRTFPLDPDLTGSGELVPVGGFDPAPDPAADMVVPYRVDVEAGLDLGMDPEMFAEAVHRTLNDDRGWTNDGQLSFSRVSAGSHDFVVTLASPGTTADWCARSGLDTTLDNVSCNSSSTERVMINAWRWAQGSETYGEDILGYRQMLINHEVGHRLGYGHVVCPEDGALAPVMMQQTKFLTIEGITCRPNPWPHPDN